MPNENDPMMNDPPRRWSALFALGVLVAAFAVPMTAPEAAAAGAHGCARYDDDAGFGGSDVSCGPVRCNKYAELLVAAAAIDKDAGVSAGFTCADQNAGCGAAAPACAGGSPGVTSSTGQGDCEAESDEVWSSMVWVACASVSGVPSDSDPLTTLCPYFPGFPTCGNTLDRIRGLCDGDPDLVNVSDDEKALLFPALFEGHTITSMVSSLLHPDGTILMLNFDAAEQTCDAVLILQH